MIEQIWKDQLSDGPFGQPLAAPEELEDVVSLMISSRIDPQRFTGNLIALVGGHSFSLNFIEAGQRFPPTPSINALTPFFARPDNIPMWFLAGFPDVEAWFHETMNDIARTCKTEDEADKRISRLLGIDSIPQSDVGQGEFENSQGHLRIRYCHNLIETYKKETDKPLETACGDGFSPDNIYLGLALLDDLGEESNATFIASMTTKYYMELVRSYANRFPNETSLLATTGVIDAVIYILGHKNIAAEQIVALATETEGCEDRLLHFVIRHVTLLLSVDTPQVPYDAVKEYCEQNADAIRRSVRRTIVSYTGDPMIMQAVRGFMTRDEFAGLREAAGVRPASSWDKMKGFFGG